MSRVTLYFIACFFCLPALAYDSVELELASGTAMSLSRFQSEGKTLLLWLPSERGFSKDYIPVANSLASMGYDLWSANLHDSYIIPTSRDSLEQVDIDDLLELLDIARQQGFEQIFLLSSSRGMQLALKMAYLWQQQSESPGLIKGLLSFSPHLIAGRPAMGQNAQYVDIAAYSNLPVYLLLAQYSTKFARSREIADRLRQGGSPVYMHALQGIQDGFHMRPREDLTPEDLAMRERLPEILSSAIELLRQSAALPLIPGFTMDDAPSFAEDPRGATLQPFQGDKQAPSLVLTDLSGRPFDLATLQDSTVLVNFWATWCGPCVEEIPSLSRLVKRMQGRPFKVVAVNIGESPQVVRHFMKSVPVNFDIILDTDSKTVRDWKVYAYPSTYLIDKSGQIQFSYRGALEWDAPDIIQTIESLL